MTMAARPASFVLCLSTRAVKISQRQSRRGRFHASTPCCVRRGHDREETDKCAWPLAKKLVSQPSARRRCSVFAGASKERAQRSGRKTRIAQCHLRTQSAFRKNVGALAHCTAPRPRDASDAKLWSVCWLPDD